MPYTNVQLSVERSPYVVQARGAVIAQKRPRVVRSFAVASPGPLVCLLISLDVSWRVYRGYQRGISPGSHIPGWGGILRPQQQLVASSRGVFLGSSFGIDWQSCRVLLLHRLVPRRGLCVLFLAGSRGSFFRAPPPPLVFFPLSRNDRTPFVCDSSAFMFSWYRGGRTRRTLLLRSGRFVLVAPSSTPMPLSRRLTLPPLVPRHPSCHAPRLFSSRLFLLRFPRSSCDRVCRTRRSSVAAVVRCFLAGSNSRWLPPLPTTDALIRCFSM